MSLRKVFYFSFICSSLIWSMDLKESENNPKKINYNIDQIENGFDQIIKIVDGQSPVKEGSRSLTVMDEILKASDSPLVKKFCDYTEKRVQIEKNIDQMIEAVDYRAVSRGDLASLDPIDKTLKEKDDSSLTKFLQYAEERFESEGNKILINLIKKINKGTHVLTKIPEKLFNRESIAFREELKSINNITYQNKIKLIRSYIYSLKKIKEMNAYFSSHKDNFFNLYVEEKDTFYKELRDNDDFINSHINLGNIPTKVAIGLINEDLRRLFMLPIRLIFIKEMETIEQDFYKKLYLERKQREDYLLTLSLSCLTLELATEYGEFGDDFLCLPQPVIGNDLTTATIAHLLEKSLPEDLNNQKILRKRLKARKVLRTKSNAPVDARPIEELMKGFDEIDEKRSKEKKKQKKKGHEKPKKTIKKSPENKALDNKEPKKIIKQKKKTTIKDINVDKQSEIIYESFDKPEVSPVSSSNQVNVQSTQVKPQVKKLKKQEMNKKNQNIVKHQEIKKVIKEETEKVQPKNEQLPNKEQIHNLNKKVLHLFIKKKQLEEELDKKKQEKFEQENQQLRTIIKKQKKENFEKYKEISKLKKSNKQKDELIKNYDISLINTNQIHEADRNMLDILARENQKLRQEINNQDLETSIICHLATENALLNQGMIELNKKIDALNKEINEILNSKKS